MHTLSSASRTCMASSSAVECTATVGMPSSLQARSTRSAISPRLAIRILSNIWRSTSRRLPHHSMIISGSPNSTGWPSSIRIWITVPARGDGNLVHGLHRLDDEQRLAGAHLAADFDEGPRARLRRDIGGADHGRGDHAGMLGRIGRSVVERGDRGGLDRQRLRVHATTAAVRWRATRTRWPSRSNSISVRPVSSSSRASSRISSWSIAGLCRGCPCSCARRSRLDPRGPLDQCGQAVDRERIAVTPKPHRLALATGAM